MKNTIAERIFDFLKDYPPFNSLLSDQLLTISKNVKVIYLSKDDYVFNQKGKINSCFYVIKEGAVGLYSEKENNLTEKCGEGNVFGLRAVMRKGKYKLTAKAIEESILYSIPSFYFDEIISENIEASKFLLTNYVSNTPHAKLVGATNNFENLETAPNFTDIQSIRFSKNTVACSPDLSIKEAAKIMTTKRVGSIIISQNNKPLGIITDKDLRTKVATGFFSIEDEVTKIMSSPIITYSEDISVAEAQIAMLQNKITHLCITKDGTSDSEIVGVLSEHDILLVYGASPSVLFKEIKRTKNTDALNQINIKSQQLITGYINQGIPISTIVKIVSKITDALTQKIIEFSVLEMEEQPPVSFGWLALGSQGRKEQLLLTDQDNALVFEDVSEEKIESTTNYFLELAAKINDKINQVGYEFCPADMMAKNPKWCLPISKWKSQFDNWITHPDEDKIMLSCIFFDFELVYGNKELGDQLSKSVFKSIDSYEIFLNFLALNALKNPPPLGFFRQFLVEDSGGHKEQFDIKARALMPLVDAARLLVLSKNIKGRNATISRYNKLAELEPQNKDLYKSCIESFKILLQFRTQQGLKHKNSGRYINLEEINKADRIKLKSAFRPIKEIQTLIKVRFQLSQMM